MRFIFIFLHLATVYLLQAFANKVYIYFAWTCHLKISFQTQQSHLQSVKAYMCAYLLLALEIGLYDIHILGYNTCCHTPLALCITLFAFLLSYLCPFNKFWCWQSLGDHYTLFPKEQWTGRQIRPQELFSIQYCKVMGAFFCF